MKTFEIEVQEMLTRIVKVEANELEEALCDVQDRYNKAEIVLSYNDFADVQFIDINTESNADEKRRLTNEVINYLIASERKHFEESMEQSELHIYKSLIRLQELNA